MMKLDVPQPFVIGLNAVIVAVTDENPRVLTVRSRDHILVAGRDDAALPYGPLDPVKDRTLERCLRGWVQEQTGLELGYVEQLYTFGDRHRDPVERKGGPRVISIAYLALVREGYLTGNSHARWLDYYSFVPWEDWREGTPKQVEQEILPLLEEWINTGGERSLRLSRRERVDIAFRMNGGSWDSERVLERYELMYEAGIVTESLLDRSKPGDGSTRSSVLEQGRPMALDHRRMVATALGRLRGKIKYRPVVFELLPATFTLFQLQRVVEALAGVRLHKQNFRRLVDRGGWSREPVGSISTPEAVPPNCSVSGARYSGSGEPRESASLGASVR